jgi:hypothetical protein
MNTKIEVIMLGNWVHFKGLVLNFRACISMKKCTDYMGLCMLYVIQVFYPLKIAFLPYKCYMNCMNCKGFYLFQERNL